MRAGGVKAQVVLTCGCVMWPEGRGLEGVRRGLNGACGGGRLISPDWFPAGRSGLSCTHSAPGRCLVPWPWCGEPGCSVRSSSTAKAPAHARLRARPASATADVVWSSVPARAAGIDVTENVIGACDELAGDGRGGDLLSPAVGYRLVGRGEFR
jgi:hypothetical protein